MRSQMLHPFQTPIISSVQRCSTLHQLASVVRGKTWSLEGSLPNATRGQRIYLKHDGFPRPAKSSSTFAANANPQYDPANPTKIAERVAVLQSDAITEPAHLYTKELLLWIQKGVDGSSVFFPKAFKLFRAKGWSFGNCMVIGPSCSA